MNKYMPLLIDLFQNLEIIEVNFSESWSYYEK